MGTVSTVPACLDELRVLLMDDSEMAGVNVFTSGVDPASAGRESIVFNEPVSTSVEYGIGTPMRIASEEYELGGVLESVQPGANETAIKAARDRAYTILAAIHDVLAVNDTVSGTVTDARMTGHEMDQGAYVDEGRVCRIKFTISVKAKYIPA